MKAHQRRSVFWIVALCRARISTLLTVEFSGHPSVRGGCLVRPAPAGDRQWPGHDDLEERDETEDESRIHTTTERV